MDESNIFIEKCEKIVSALIEYNKDPSTTTRPKYTQILFHKKLTYEEYSPKYEEYAYNLSYAKNFEKQIFNNDTHELSFMILWEYSEFVRWCEKMFLYENDTSQSLYSDTPIDSLDARTLIINKKGFSIIINLRMSQKADFDNKSDKLIFHEIQEIHVKRSYGKELMNKFRIVDNNVKFNDNSDKLLFELINEIIFETLSNHFSKLLHDINDGNFIKNMMFNNMLITP